MALPQRYLEHPQNTLFTENEYFAFSERAEERWEFTPVGPPGPDGTRRGRLRMMAGGTPDHSAITANVIRTLGNALVPRGCRVFNSDLKIHTGDGVNTFPDVSVVCGGLTLYAGHNDIVTNPLLIVEVLSHSTAAYDMCEKFAHYQTIPTLADYMLVAQDKALAILHSRAGDHWATRLVSGLDKNVYLPSVDAPLALADVYALIEFPSKTEPETTEE